MKLTIKKTVIANWGHSNQGKSESIRKVAQTILQAFPTATTDPASIDYNQDIKVIIKIGIVTIGIESQGDPNSRLFESLEEFASIPCDIVICSTRTSGSTVEVVEDMHKNHDYDIVWVTNHRSKEKDQAELNKMSALNIVELIRRVMAGGW